MSSSSLASNSSFARSSSVSLSSSDMSASGLRKGWSHLGSILFPFGPTVHLLVVVLAILLVHNLAVLLDPAKSLSLEG
ncbi:hypothetical protein T05_936 [Trichinella murrelli]|uniref:Uncharacterized protein n=1 Tax=Trichinella murrelli TaxID=144512 RepID=A0A0V0TU39_9BILA|nr:hypothetical protein T05_936 [Trichinella murrelli]